MQVFDKFTDLPDVLCYDLMGGGGIGFLDVRISTDLDHLPKSNCMLSETLVGGHQVCQGQLIFNDNFDTFSTAKWEKEIRIPLDSDNAEFVSYQDYPQNCYIQTGALNIVPTLLSSLPGFYDDLIRTGHLNFGPK